MTDATPTADEAGELTGSTGHGRPPETPRASDVSTPPREPGERSPQEGAVLTDEAPESGSSATAAPPRRSMRSNRPAYLLIGLVARGLLAVNVARWVSDDSDEAASSPGVTIAEPGGDALPRPAFTLTDVEGEPFDFATETGGQLTFLFFGYTNCPDICPVQMATLTAALAEMPEVGAQVVFVTTDPARDDPERLRSWLTNFQRPIVGLTGTPEQVAAAQDASRVTVAVAGEPDQSGRYEVGHAASVLVYGPDDLLRASLPSGTTQTEWTSAIRQLTSGS